MLILITREFGLSRDYEPRDLVALARYLPSEVTLGYDTQVRQVIVEPLVQLIDAMYDAGLQPTVISGYRSYAAQAIAWSKWLQREPERANMLSAPPGFSEHQLGTTVDFGSPELEHIVGQADIQFHTHFYLTQVGQWLLEHAPEFGFTLSYPREAFEVTGFFYEPWHFRYVGSELATQLREQGISLTQHLLETQAQPCIP